MSLVTRCPACATQFKVVPDQLKLSDGWVRCGHCSDVFDATRYLENWADGIDATAASEEQQPLPHRQMDMPATQQAVHEQPTAVETAAPAQPPLAPPMSPVPSAVATAPQDADELDMDLELDEPDLPIDITATQPGAAGSAGSVPLGRALAQRDAPLLDGASDFHTELKQFAATLGKSAVEPERGPADAVAPLPASVPTDSSPSLQAPQKGAITAPSDSETLEDPPLEPGFVRQARRRAFWRSPGMRALLALVALVLSALLGAQWALQERDRLAAVHPDWQPLLSTLCEPLGCSIAAVRDLQAVVIDSSTLTRRIGDFYSFDLVLKNNASIPLAVPALELSLTDTADSVISRRVFLPEELPGVPSLLPPSSTVSVSLRLSLAGGGDLPMAGYRALVFYP